MAPFKANPIFIDSLGDIHQRVGVGWFFGGGGCKQLIDDCSSVQGLLMQRQIRHPHRHHKADHGVLGNQEFVSNGGFDHV